ncbi:MAG: GntR family transcriptional regulator, partial [Geminicoccaceae bacterium]
MHSIQPIRRRRIYQELVEALERSIRNGELRAGDPLPPERELMRLFEVGRPAVREALFALQKMGLVAISTGARARVTRPTPQVIINELSGAVRHLLTEPEGMRHMQGART